MRATAADPCEAEAAEILQTCVNLKRESRRDRGKSNRVLHTKPVPKGRKMGFPWTTREDYRVRSTGKKIGLTDIRLGVI